MSHPSLVATHKTLGASATKRPPWLRALGAADPPLVVTVGGHEYRRTEIAKHDSWAATAFYESADRKIVCKFHRRQSAFGVPLAWLGRWLARHERTIFNHLAELPGVPAELGAVRADGREHPNAISHVFVEGHVIGEDERLGDRFFDSLERLILELHERQIAYVDLHKRENVLRGDDGRPHLFDFQASFVLPDSAWIRWTPLPKLLRLLQGCDVWNLRKQRLSHSYLYRNSSRDELQRYLPWWLQAHRRIAEPLRNLRRRLLVALGVRRNKGEAASEANAEIAFRH